MKKVNVDFNENSLHDLEHVGVTENVLKDICRVLNEAYSDSDFQPYDEQIVEYEYENGVFVDRYYWSIGKITPNHMGTHTVEMFC